MGIHHPPRCDACKAPLIIHCGSHTCDWWRCPNPGCEWGVIDLRRRLRLHSDGHVEAVPA